MIFTQVFKNNFTKPFPHEHLDRPHCRLTRDMECVASWGRHAVTSPERTYASKLANGESAIGSQDQSTYEYLDEDRRVASTLIAMIDRDWASKYLTTGVDYRTDLAFHQGLADLGHALHAVEDFFAHSNFIELAAMSRGETYVRGQLYGPSRREWLPSATRRILERSRSDFDATKVFRRLKRFDPDVERQEQMVGWAFLQSESSVVTGYFDGRDTVMSLLHALEEIFEFDRSEIASDPFSDYLRRYSEDRVDEFRERIVNIQQGLNQQTAEGRLRSDLRTLLDYYTENRRLDGLNRAAAERDIRSEINQRRLFRDVPRAILDVVVTLVYLLVDSALVTVQAGRIGWNLYKLIKAIVELFTNPLGFLTEPFNSKPFEGGWFNLKFLAEWIYLVFFDDQLDTIRFQLRTKLHEMIGGYRVGSHSLLAKDYADEVLFPQAFNCARALHWYIVDTMCRWTDTAWLDQAGDSSTWIDWNELLGAFLRHPLKYQNEPVLKPDSGSMSVLEPYQVTATGETFRSIATARLVSQTFNGVTYGSYEELLIANLGSHSVFRNDPFGGVTVDEESIAKRVIETGMGSRDASGRSYQLRRGLTVWIPMTIEVYGETASETPWYAEMMDLDTDRWREQMAVYRREKTLRSRPPFEYHRLKYQTPGERDRFISEGLDLKSDLEKRYNSPTG